MYTEELKVGDLKQCSLNWPQSFPQHTQNILVFCGIISDVKDEGEENYRESCTLARPPGHDLGYQEASLSSHSWTYPYLLFKRPPQIFSRLIYVLYKNQAFFSIGTGAITVNKITNSHPYVVYILVISINS